MKTKCLNNASCDALNWQYALWCCLLVVDIVCLVLVIFLQCLTKVWTCSWTSTSRVGWRVSKPACSWRPRMGSLFGLDISPLDPQWGIVHQSRITRRRKTPSQQRRDDRRKADFLAKKNLGSKDSSGNTMVGKILISEPKDEIELEEPKAFEAALFFLEDFLENKSCSYYSNTCENQM